MKRGGYVVREGDITYLLHEERAYLVREEESLPCPCRREPTLSVKKRAYLVLEEESLPCPLSREPTLSVKKRAYLVREEDSLPST